MQHLPGWAAAIISLQCQKSTERFDTPLLLDFSMATTATWCLHYKGPSEILISLKSSWKPWTNLVLHLCLFSCFPAKCVLLLCLPQQLLKKSLSFAPAILDVTSRKCSSKKPFFSFLLPEQKSIWLTLLADDSGEVCSWVQKELANVSY